MDYDSSGTDDDLPRTHQNRVPRGGRIAATGRSAFVSVPYPSMYGESETEMDAQIHQLEQEAYSSVLRAFKAQADAITWERQSFLTELRKELRLSNEEHRKLLGLADADDAIQRIREWRQGGRLQPGMPCPTLSVSRKKQKRTPSVPSQSFGELSAPFQLSTSAAKRGLVPGAKGSNKHKPSLPYPSSSASGRAQLANRVSSGAIINEAAMFDKLIGRRLRTRWPDDNNFYEAVITDYNAINGQHALVYDIGTPNEMLEWVHLSEISPDDMQWEGYDPGVCQQGAYGGSGHGSIPGAGRDGEVPKPSREDYLPSENGTGKKAPDDIQIPDTDTLIKEVESVFGANHPDSREIEKAKKVLKDHEEMLIEAIARLADTSYDEGGHFWHRQSMERV